MRNDGVRAERGRGSVVMARKMLGRKRRATGRTWLDCMKIGEPMGRRSGEDGGKSSRASEYDKDVSKE